MLDPLRGRGPTSEVQTPPALVVDPRDPFHSSMDARTKESVRHTLRPLADAHTLGGLPTPAPDENLCCRTLDPVLRVGWVGHARAAAGGRCVR